MACQSREKNKLAASAREEDARKREREREIESGLERAGWLKLMGTDLLAWGRQEMGKDKQVER